MHIVRSTFLLAVACVAVCCSGRVVAQDVTIAANLSKLQQVGPGGVGHDRAMQAFTQLTETVKADRLDDILDGMKGANPLAENWIRAAVNTIAARGVKDGTLSAASLETYIKDTNDNPPSGRNLAWQWLDRIDPSTANKLLPGMLNDPSLALRRLAVEDHLKTAKTSEQLKLAFDAARDLDQVEEIARRLKGLEQKASVTEHMGAVPRWKIIAPFDNTDRAGFDTVYPPEKEIDLSARYQGKEDTIRWKEAIGKGDLALLDFNAEIKQMQNVTAYAMAELYSNTERNVQLRMKTFNANKVWLNGKLLISNEIYHSGAVFDQYKGLGLLKKGRNVIMVKLCQDDQPQSWAKVWNFSLRVCDETGLGVNSTPPGKGANR